MDAARRALNLILDLLPRGQESAEPEHETIDMYATVVPDPNVVGDHELEGVVTYVDRYVLKLCYDGRVYEVLLREATRYQPSGSLRSGAFVRIHGTWDRDKFAASQIVRIG